MDWCWLAGLSEAKCFCPWCSCLRQALRSQVASVFLKESFGHPFLAFCSIHFRQEGLGDNWRQFSSSSSFSFLCVSVEVWWVGVGVGVDAGMGRSEDNLRCQPSPSTRVSLLFATVSQCLASWPSLLFVCFAGLLLTATGRCLVTQVKTQGTGAEECGIR